MKYSILCIGLLLSYSSIAQLMGIGTDNPSRAKLEVWGVAGTGKTAGLFGGQQGISVQRNYAGIGFNQYQDNTTYGRYMGNGFAASMIFRHDDPGLAAGLTLNMFPSGTADAAIGSVNTVWRMTRNNRLQILSTGAGGSAELDIGRGTGFDGAAMFQGTNYHSHFCYSGDEHTYIRGGKIASNLYINDVNLGKVILGNGTSTVGVNTNYYVPPTTLEVRQSNGGIRMIHTTYPALAWEMRVNLSPSDLYLYYQGGLKTWFSRVDGAMTATSDARLKEDIHEMKPVLEKLMRLKPVTYEMENGITGRRFIGFIAQEIEPFFPELLVREMGDDKQLFGLNYAGFNVIAVKAIQEEEQQINAIDESVIDLENRLKAIESKINAPAFKK